MSDGRAWYWAESRDSEHWTRAGDTLEEAVEGRSHGFVAPEVEPTSDADFWRRVADLVLWRLEEADEALAEEGLISPEDAWLTAGAVQRGEETVEQKLAAALAKVLPSVLERPAWRTVAIEEAVDLVHGLPGRRA